MAASRKCKCLKYDEKFKTKYCEELYKIKYEVWKQGFEQTKPVQWTKIGKKIVICMC